MSETILPQLLSSLPPESAFLLGLKRLEQIAAARKTQAATSAPVWTPQHRKTCSGVGPCDCPQIAAYNSDADIIGYGGAAGGGKTDLLLGYAGTKHRRSIIFRRVFPSLRAMIERSREIYNRSGESHAKDSYNEQLHVWRLSDERLVELGAVQYEKDKAKHQGQPRDFVGFDEVTEFPESVVRFLMGWNRTTLPGQKCRVVMTFNPPMDEAGEWVTRFFAPWLDPRHSRPAQDGELRWYAMVAKEEREVDGPEPFEHDGEVITPRSRTFFHAALKDNPILEATGYGATIDALPEPLRSFLRGNFDAARVANPFQVIPTEWVRLAMDRWKLTARPDMPQTALGADVAYGGRDKFVVAPRWGYYVGKLLKYRGQDTPDGATGAGYVLAARQDDAAVNIDYIGWGTAAYEHLRELVPTVPISFAEGTSATDRNGRLKFANVRAAAYWRMRDLLDPESGYSVCLPDDPELMAELTAPRWEISGGKIKIEPKEDIKKRLDRSPDSADAVVLAFWGDDPLPAGRLAAANAPTGSRFVRNELAGSRWNRQDGERGWHRR